MFSPVNGRITGCRGALKTCVKARDGSAFFVIVDVTVRLARLRPALKQHFGRSAARENATVYVTCEA